MFALTSVLVNNYTADEANNKIAAPQESDLDTDRYEPDRFLIG